MPPPIPMAEVISIVLKSQGGPVKGILFPQNEIGLDFCLALKSKKCPGILEIGLELSNRFSVVP